MERRVDHYTALLIDAVLSERKRMGINPSTRNLLNLGLPLAVTERVLDHPEMRRAHSEHQEIWYRKNWEIT